MSRRSVVRLAALAATIVGIGCASVPLPERQGVVLYRKKCGACHRPYAPSEIKPAEWEKTIVEMKTRAKLTDAEVLEIRSYVEPDLIPSHAVSRSRS